MTTASARNGNACWMCGKKGEKTVPGYWCPECDVTWGAQSTSNKMTDWELSHTCGPQCTSQHRGPCGGFYDTGLQGMSSPG